MDMISNGVKKYLNKLSGFEYKMFFAVFLFVAMAGFFIPKITDAAFIHPGILSTAEELSFIKTKVQQGAQPWKAAYDAMKASSFGSLSYVPHPYAVVECGYYSNPNIGCTDETNDAIAAYTHALLWYLNGNQAHAQKAIEIMNAWSAIMTGHTNANAKLQAAWSGSVFPRAAEIIRYTYTGWSATDVTRFSNMLKNAYLPNVINQDCGYPQNWNLSFIEAMAHISVFNNDQTTFDKAMARWRSWVPAAYYMESDGSVPLKPSGCTSIGGYYGATTYVDGLCQETCRDLGHMQYGLAAMLNTAETAKHQGVDLYGEQSNRITTSMEFHAGYILSPTVPNWLCGGTLDNKRGWPTWEIGYNHYHNRLGMSLPNTLNLINTIRPTDEEFHMVWETLTHAGLGNVGTAPTPTPTKISLTGWTWCAYENGTCSFTGTKEVRFGTNTQYYTKTLSASTACTWSVFGDPAPGVAKQCHYRTAPTPTPTPTPTATPTPTPTATVTYENHSITNQTGSFIAEFDAKPTQSNSDVVIGLSNVAVDAYADMATILRFNNLNQIDARNGSAYIAKTILNYTPNTIYHVRMDINITAKTYTVYVTPQGGAPTTIAQNYDFRTEQSAITNLNNWAKVTTAGGATVTNFTISPVPTPTPTPTPTNTLCHLLTSSTATPTGYGASYNVLTSAKELLMSVLCQSTSATITIGNNSNLQYIYNKGYLYRNNQWQQVSYSCSNLVSSAWCVGNANATINLTTTELSNTNYIVGYICNWTGSAWKCGCRDSACSTNYWNLQTFRK